MNLVLSNAVLRLHRAVRIPFLRPVHIRVGTGPAPLQRLFSADLSRGGMFIRTPRPVPEGTPVEVFLEAKGRVLRFGRGEVRHALPLGQASQKGRLPGFGVRFIGLPARSRALIDHLLREATWTRADALADTAQRVPAPSPAPAASAPRSPRTGNRRLAVALALLALCGAGGLGAARAGFAKRIAAIARH